MREEETYENYRRKCCESAKEKKRKSIIFYYRPVQRTNKSIIQKHLASFEDVQEECMDDVLLAIWNHIEKYDEEKNTLKIGLQLLQNINLSIMRENMRRQ